MANRMYMAMMKTGAAAYGYTFAYRRPESEEE